jgi:hypothetical protein
MTFVGTRMHSNAIGAEKFTILGNLKNIGVITATGIPYRCHFVNVYTQFCFHVNQ